MKKYNVEVVETLSRVVEIEADNFEDAREFAATDYADEIIVLDWEDLESTKYLPYPSQKIKENFNINIAYDKNSNQLYIGNEKHFCKDKDMLLEAIKSYVDNNISFKDVEPIKYKEKER